MTTNTKLNVTIPAHLPNLSEEEKRSLEKLLHDYGKARRMCHSFRRKRMLNLTDISQSEIIRNVRKTLGLNSWYVNTACRSIESLPLTGVNFGGRKAKEKLDRGLISREDWRKMRNNILASEGEALRKGNRCLRIIEKDGSLKLRVTTGIRQWIYLDLYIPDKYLGKYGHLLDGSKAYKVVIHRRQDGDGYSVKITVHPERKLNAENRDRIMALDINSGHIDWVVVDKRNRRLIESGRINCYQVIDASSNKTENILHEVVNKIGNIAEHHGAEVVAGKLSSRLNSHSQANRRIMGMSQFKLRKILSYKLLLRGIPFKERSEAYTSILGRLFCKPLGLDIHKGSAYAFALKVIDYSFFKLLKDSLQNEADGRWNRGNFRINRLTAYIQFLACGHDGLDVDDPVVARLLPEDRIGKGSPMGFKASVTPNKV